jgi:hypothetical protein
MASAALSAALLIMRKFELEHVTDDDLDVDEGYDLPVGDVGWWRILEHNPPESADEKVIAVFGVDDLTPEQEIAAYEPIELMVYDPPLSYQDLKALHAALEVAIMAYEQGRLKS